MGHDGIPDGECAVEVMGEFGHMGSITRFRNGDEHDALDYARIFLPGTARLVRYNANTGKWEPMGNSAVQAIAASQPIRPTADQVHQSSIAETIFADLRKLTGMLS